MISTLLIHTVLLQYKIVVGVSVTDLENAAYATYVSHQYLPIDERKAFHVILTEGGELCYDSGPIGTEKRYILVESDT